MTSDFEQISSERYTTHTPIINGLLIFFKHKSSL